MKNTYLVESNTLNMVYIEATNFTLDERNNLYFVDGNEVVAVFNAGGWISFKKVDNGKTY